MASLVFLMPLLLQTASATPADAAAGAQPIRLAANETVAPAPAKAKGEKLICKRRARTGSLAGTERSCHTKAEWQKIADGWREAWQEVQGAKGSTHGG